LAIYLFWLALKRASRGKLPRNVLIASGLVAILVGASFNVWLETPYLAPLAWLLVGYSISQVRESDASVGASRLAESRSQ
jgi:hypothetical protein